MTPATGVLSRRPAYQRTKSLIACRQFFVESIHPKQGRYEEDLRAYFAEAHSSQEVARAEMLGQLWSVDIQASEVNDLLAIAAAIRGVRSVSNELEPHDSAEGVPSLQGERNLAGPTLDILQRNWAPGTRALVTAAGLAAAGICFAAYARR